MTDPRVIVALDFADPRQALALARRLRPDVCRLKVGKELFVRAGADFVARLQGLGFEVFLDLKFHDIPNTVAAACRAAAELGVWMVNVHALGGAKMMAAAAAALAEREPRPLGIAVTVLISMDDNDLRDVGITGGAAVNVGRLAAAAAAAGLDGVVCSAWEASALRQSCGERFCLVTPGIRPAGADTGAGGDDQRRVATPAAALAAGADYLVVGRPITRAADPLRVLRDIQRQLDERQADATHD